MKTDDLPSVAGRMEMTHQQFQHACQVALREMQQNPISCDNSLVHILCEAVRCSRECCEIIKLQSDAYTAGRVAGLREADIIANAAKLPSGTKDWNGGFYCCQEQIASLITDRADRLAADATKEKGSK